MTTRRKGRIWRNTASKGNKGPDRLSFTSGGDITVIKLDGSVTTDPGRNAGFLNRKGTRPVKPRKKSITRMDTVGGRAAHLTRR